MRLTSRASALAVFTLAAMAAGPLDPAAAQAQTQPQPAPKAPAVTGSQTTVKDSMPVPTVTRVEPKPVAITTESAPQPIGFEADVYCFGYIGDPNEQFPVQVMSAENLYEQIDYITHDLLYVDGGYDRGLRVGDNFWIVTAEQEVIHPMTGKSVGRFYQYRGRATVVSVEPRAAIVRVTNTCTDVPLGAYLKHFEPIPIPLARRSPLAQAGDPPSGKAKGRIIYTRDGLVALGATASVMVDLGAADGIQPGDFLTVYRYSTGREYGIGPVGAYWVNVPPPPGVAIPRTYLGEAAVLLVGDRWSVVRLTESTRLIEVGDEVELK